MANKTENQSIDALDQSENNVSAKPYQMQNYTKC